MKIARSLILYFATFFLNAALSFGVFSLTSHYLKEDDLGTIYLYSGFTILLVPFISIGTQFVLSVEYFKLPFEKYRAHFSNGILIPVITTVFFTVLFLLLYYPLRRFIPVTFFYAIILPFSCFLIVMNEIFMSLIRNKEKHNLFAVYSISKNLLEVLSTILLVVIIGMNWKGRLASALLTSLTTSFVIFYFIKKWNLLGESLQQRKIKEIARTGLPFIPERFSIFILGYSAGYFINYFNGIGDVGFYSAGMQIATIVNVSTLALINIFHPILFKNLAGVPNYNNVRRATFSFIGISLFIVLSVITATPFLFSYFIGSVFQPGKIYAIFLSIGYFFWAVYAIFLGFLLFLKKNKTIMLISIIGMSASIILNAINVKSFGAMGAVYTAMGVNFLMAIMMIIATGKNYNLKVILAGGKNEKASTYN